jgi:hypothetical protein
MSVTTELMALGLPAAVSTKIADSFIESDSANTFTGLQTFGSAGIATDVIAEKTAATGVTVDGLIIKDGGITFAAGGTLDADSGTVTLSSNAGTVSKMAGIITTESLTTAAGSGQDLTITNTLCASTSIILVTRTGGTSATGTPVIKAVPGAGSFVITLDNKHASAAFNGTFILSYLLILA